MHHIILHLCMIIKCKDPHLYFSCSVYVGLKIKMDARKKFVGLLFKCNFYYSCNVAVPLQPMVAPTQPP